MKKFISVCALFLVIISQSFAGADFFNHRFFEVKVDVPVNVTNNTFSVADFLQKEVILDIEKIYKGMPKKGLDLSINSTPSANITFDLKKGLHFGISAGINTASTINISKDLFKFIAEGNRINEELDVGINGYADAFAFATVDIGWNADRFKFRVQPSAFAAIMHANSDNSYFKFSNTEDGAFNLDLNSKFDIYSAVALSDDSFKDTNSLINDFVSGLVPSMGFDLAGQVDYKLLSVLTVSGNIRVPIVPSKLKNKSVFSCGTSGSVSLDDLFKNKDDDSDGEGGASSGGGENPDGEDPKLFDFTTDFSDSMVVDYFINRPLKMSISADFHPFSWIMSYYGTLGFGIQHPFSPNSAETYFYVDYLIGTRISLFNILSLYLSTERTDEIFKHKAVLALNFRLIEVDAGIAFESPNLQTSFKGPGLGAFVTASIGF